LRELSETLLFDCCEFLFSPTSIEQEREEIREIRCQSLTRIATSLSWKNRGIPLSVDCLRDPFVSSSDQIVIKAVIETEMVVKIVIEEKIQKVSRCGPRKWNRKRGGKEKEREIKNKMMRIGVDS